MSKLPWILNDPREIQKIGSLFRVLTGLGEDSGQRSSVTTNYDAVEEDESGTFMLYESKMPENYT